jgi:hypothetical protein
MPPPIWLPKKRFCHRYETLVIRIKDYDDIPLQFHPFPLGMRGIKGKERGLTALTALTSLTAHIFVA